MKKENQIREERMNLTHKNKYVTYGFFGWESIQNATIKAHLFFTTNK